MAPVNQPPSQTRQNVGMGAGRNPVSSSPPSLQQQQRQRNDAAAESWIEVSSHPSSSSVSSAGEEIITTGLRVGNTPAARRPRLHPQPAPRSNPAPPAPYHLANPAATSSQEEYDESDSDDDHILTSSTEHMAPHRSGARTTPLRQEFLNTQHADSDSSDDDDDRGTALGRRTSESFRPQPNAFSHPPSHLTHRHSTSSATSYHHARPSLNQRSQSRVEHRTPNFMSPDYREDNDAALRASLTTLLSCAAAARGRDKDGKTEQRQHGASAGGSQPVELRLVPENELMSPDSQPATSQPSSSGPSTAKSSRETQQSIGEKTKRSATPPSGTRAPRATKKKKVASASSEEATFISPTLLTWAVGASVVVFISVVGFGAGYVIGREVGRQENIGALGGVGNASSVADGASCGKEVLRGGGGTLKRFRWGSGFGGAVKT